MPKIFIALLALCALAGTSFAATRKRHTPKPAPKSKAVKTATRSKHSARRGATAHARRSYQAAPTPERYRQIQQALADKGYFKGHVNGEWGGDSVAALQRFQADQNLEPNGKLGSLSLIALGLGPKRMTAQARPEQQTVAPNQVNPPPQTKQ